MLGNQSTPVKEAQRRRERIDRLYDMIDNAVTLIPDQELQDRALDWLDRADQAPAASLLDHVEQTLTEFETQFAMYRTEMNGETDFPDECSGCEHHPHACPLFTKRVERIERERLQEELVGASEEEVKQRLRQLAGRVGCQVITTQIDEWSEEFGDLMEEGRDIRREVVHVLRPSDREGKVAEATASLDDGGGGR